MQFRVSDKPKLHTSPHNGLQMMQACNQYSEIDVLRLKYQHEGKAGVLTFQLMDIAFESFMNKPAAPVLSYEQLF